MLIPVPDKSLDKPNDIIPSRALGSGEVLFKSLTNLSGFAIISNWYKG